MHLREVCTSNNNTQSDPIKSDHLWISVLSSWISISITAYWMLKLVMLIAIWLLSTKYIYVLIFLNFAKSSFQESVCSLLTCQFKPLGPCCFCALFVFKALIVSSQGPLISVKFFRSILCWKQGEIFFLPNSFSSFEVLFVWKFLPEKNKIKKKKKKKSDHFSVNWKWFYFQIHCFQNIRYLFY